MDSEKGKIIVCPDCKTTIDLKTSKHLNSNRCPNCNSNLGSLTNPISKLPSTESDINILKNNIKPDSSQKSIYTLVGELINNKVFSTTLIGSFGLLMVSFAFIQIISSLEVSVPLYYLTLTGIATFAILMILSFYLMFRGKMESFSIFLILMLGEIILVSSLYFVDINQSSSFNRHAILSTALVFSVLIPFSNSLIKDFKYESIHRVILVYLSWLIILYVAGHAYISEVTLTTIIVIMLISFHYSILKSPVSSVVISTLVLEFLVLIQTRFINTVNYAIVTFFAIISFPLIAALLDMKEKNQNQEAHKSNLQYLIPRSSLFALIQIPQIAIAIGIVSGGTISPLSELLIGVYCISWVGYLQFHKKYLNEELTFFKKQSYVISIVMIISVSIFSIDNDGWNVIPLFIAVIVLVIFLLENVESGNQLRIQVMGVLSNGFITINLILNDFMTSYVGLLFYFIFSMMYFWKEIGREREIRDYIFYSITVTGALMMSYLFVRDPLSVPVEAMIEYSVSLLLLTLLYVKFHDLSSKVNDLFKDDMSYLTASFAVALPFNIFFTDLADENLKYWVLLGTSLVLTTLLFFKQKEITPKMMVLSFLVLVLPLIYSLTIYSNEIYSTSLTLLIFSFAWRLVRSFATIESQDNKIWLSSFAHIFFALAILSKSVILGSSKIITSDFRYGDLILLITYASWILFILYSFHTVYIINFHNLQSIIIGFFLNYVIFLQIINTIGENTLEATIHIFYFLNQLLILGAILIIIKRKLNLLISQDLYHLGLSVILVTELITLNLFSFAEILLYHSILLILIFIDSNNEIGITKKWISGMWVILVEFTIILFANYNILTLQLMLLFLFGSLIFQFKPRNIIENFMNLNRDPVKILIYETIVMSFIFLITLLSSNYVLNFVNSYSLYLVLTIIYFAHNKGPYSYSNLVILNLFVIIQIYWTSEILIKSIEYHILFIISFVVIIIYVIYSSKDLLFKIRTPNTRLYFDLPAFGIAPVFVLSFIQISQIFVYDFQLSNQIFNQIMGFALLVIAGLLLAADERVNSSNLIDGFVTSAFLTGFGLALFGFFNSVASNLLISLMVFIFIVLYVKTKSGNILNIGQALYVLSLIKVIIDLFILDTLDQGISFFVVGLNGVLFALILQSDKQKQIQNK